MTDQQPTDERATMGSMGHENHLSFSASRSHAADGLQGVAGVVVSDLLTTTSTNELVRALSIRTRWASVDDGARLLVETHQLKFVVANGREAIEMSGGPLMARGAEDVTVDGRWYELVIKPKNEMTWAQVSTESDLEFVFTLRDR
jgi:hypothetical protein